jgi:hypothetical protein
MFKTWRNVDLRLQQQSDGLSVTQAGESYLARDWYLTDQVVSFVDLCVENGLPCVIRYSHPRRHLRAKGVQYLAFSRTPAERWVCVLDQYSPKARREADLIDQVTFEKHYRVVLEKGSIPWSWERAGGKNIFVPFDRLQSAIPICAQAIELVESALGARHWESTKASIGFVTESLLESWVLQRWTTIARLSSLKLLGNQIHHMDILAEHEGSGSLVVFELKRGPAGLEVLDQLRGYVQSDHTVRLAQGGDVWGAIIAGSFSPHFCGIAEREPYPLALFTFEVRAEDLSLSLLASTWPL